jgi:hypothetical protein
MGAAVAGAGAGAAAAGAAGAAIAVVDDNANAKIVATDLSNMRTGIELMTCRALKIIRVRAPEEA